MLKVVIYILAALIIVYCLHYVIINVGNLKKSKKLINNKKNNFFAILIAARDEELVIKNLIESLKKQNYPKNCFNIYVIINNCTDNTSKIAKEAGAKIIECKEPIKSKGEALKYAFNKLKNNKEIDVYAIFDADNVVDKNFLCEMNNTVNSGYSVAQGFRDTKNAGDNWISSSYAILYYIENLFINKARYNLGKSSFINGTGFVVSKKIIDKYGFEPKTLTEDIEFNAMCALNGEKIAYNEYAITYDEQITDFNMSLKQRKRWSYGAIECLKEYYPKLIKKGLTEKNFECIDTLLFYLSSIFHVLVAIFSVLIIIDIIPNIKNLPSINEEICLCIIIAILIISSLSRLFVIKKNHKSVKENIGGILLFDLFMLSWLPINFLCLFIKKCTWDKIIHNRNIDISEVEN